mmetsp:Transcript_3764/g.9309  ORF Transcript_3764/g.9309 Transcript_3764/m.9309 type:complete len:208 (+) Transcript_3764:96-719(+)
MDLVEERRVVARERGLRDLAREGEHGQAPVLELGVLLAAQLDRVRGLEDAAELEVARLAVAVHRRDAGRDARERLEEADEEEDLAERAGRDEPVVRLPADVGALELLARHADERRHDHADRREHAHAAVLELGLAEPRHHARVAAREVHGVEVVAAAQPGLAARDGRVVEDLVGGLDLGGLGLERGRRPRRRRRDERRGARQRESQG